MNTTDTQNNKVGASLAAVILLLAMVFTVFAPVDAIAEGEEATVQDTMEEPAEAPAEVVVPPTSVPVSPTAVPVPPTEVPLPPTVTPVEPTVVPTEIPLEPTAVPPMLVPTEMPTNEPTATAEPGPTATTSPSPTLVPQPVVSFTEAEKPACNIAPNQGASVAHGESIDYLCTHSVAISGTDVAPSTIDVTWTIRAAIGGNWTVSLLPPVNDHVSETPQWTPGNSSQASFTFSQLDPVGTGTTPSTVDAKAQIQFRLRVDRSVCSRAAQTIQIDHSVNVTVATEGATVAAKPIGSQSLLVTPSLARISDPAVTFDGPLTFGDVGVTSAGPETPVRSGSATLTITGLDDACGRHIVRVAASPMADPSGAILEGSQLTLVSVNNEPIPGDACNLAGGCDVVALIAGPDAASSQTVVLGVELRMPEQPNPGAYGTSLDASLKPATGD